MVPYERRQVDRIVSEAIARFADRYPGVRPVVDVSRVDGEVVVSVHVPRIELV